MNNHNCRRIVIASMDFAANNNTITSLVVLDLGERRQVFSVCSWVVWVCWQLVFSHIQLKRKVRRSSCFYPYTNFLIIHVCMNFKDNDTVEMQLFRWSTGHYININTAEKYRNFTWFPGVEILRKSTVPA